LNPIRQLVISSEVGQRKPAAAFFQAICRHADAPPGQIVHIGDDLENDLAGATAAGMTSILFDPGRKHLGQTDRRIDRLTELVALFDRNRRRAWISDN
jgi:putative hydrolase of the HAD superfamily